MSVGGVSPRTQEEVPGAPNALFAMYFARRDISSRSAATLVVALTVALAVAPVEARSRRVPPEKWKKSLSQERYTSIESSVHFLEADDGTSLSLRLHLPGGVPKGQKLPTLLQITPYQAWWDLNPSTPARTAPPYEDWAFFVRRGAAYVEADARGTGASEGCTDFGGRQDRADARAFVRWIKQQPWSNGRVATDGISHPGMGSVVAHAGVKGLTGALAHAPVVSYYQDEWLQGAKFEDQLNGPFYQWNELNPPLTAHPQAIANQAAPCTGDTVTDFSGYDGAFGEVWQDRDLSRHPARSRTPVLLTHGFVDLNVHPDHSQLYWDALPDDYPKYLIAGWWYHGWPDLAGHPFFGIENRSGFDQLRHRWLDALLFDAENGLWDEPRVLIEDSKGVWHESHEWPLDGSRHIALNPTPAGTLTTGAAKRGNLSYKDGLQSFRGEWDGTSVVFRSPPLKDARLVNGAPEVELVASSDQSMTKWVAYLIDEAPDGSWERISHGYADSHTWGAEDEWLEMEPGRPYRWTLKLLPTAVVVAKGHRVTLVITSQDSSYTGNGCFSDYRTPRRCYSPSGILPSPTAGRATNTIYLGPGKTRMNIDWVDPDVTAKPPWRAGA